jgi:NAD(P)-dependent dehydrogenase (short-subunit alcohol dehydrogenase family)
MDARRFVGKSVLVTGGAGAIGGAAVRRFGAEGARVAVVDRDRPRTEALVADLHRDGVDAIGVVVDVSSEAGAARAVRQAVAAFGGLDVVFNNAGIAGRVALVHELSAADWDEIVRINLRGVFLVQREGLRAMIDAGTGGAVVNMSSSMAGFDVLSGGAGYAATKHAILGLTRAAALDAAPYGIRVNAVCPGVVESSLGVPAVDPDARHEGVGRFAARIPLRRIGQPEDVAAVVAFLASEDAAHVTGVGWLIDGGQTMQSWSNAPEEVAYPLARGDARTSS